MIVGWLVKLVVGFVLLGVLAVEIGAPLITRVQLDGIAQDAADSAALALFDRAEPEAAQMIAEEVAAEDDAEITKFEITPEGVKVTIEREARSVILKKIDNFKSWYQVKVTATSKEAKN